MVGVCGKNIPADLHNENLNRLCKEAIKGLGANKTKSGIIRVGKVLNTIDTIITNCDIENDIIPPSGKHSKIRILKLA